MSYDARMGHPDPNHPTNLFKGDAGKLVDYHGNPVVSKAPWSDQHTGLWLSMAVSTMACGIQTPKEAGDIKPNVTRATFGGVWFTLATTEGLPSYSTKTFGLCLELPADLARDELKKTYVMEWVKETALECLQEAKDHMDFKGLLHPSKFGEFLHDSAEHMIKRTGL